LNSQGWKTSKKKEESVWGLHFEEMGRKTVLRRLFKYLPVSIELASASAIDEVAASGRSQALDTVLDGDYITPSESDDQEGVDPSTGELTDQRAQQDDAILPAYGELLAQVQKADSMDVLDMVMDSARGLPEADAIKLAQAYDDRREVLMGA
jgi:recombination protein RecT